MLFWCWLFREPLPATQDVRSPATLCCVTQLDILLGAHLTCCDVRNLLSSLPLWLFQLESLECCSTPQKHSGWRGGMKPAPALATWCVQLTLLGSHSTSWMLRSHLYQVSSSTSETRRMVLPLVSASYPRRQKALPVVSRPREGGAFGPMRYQQSGLLTAFFLCKD